MQGRATNRAAVQSECGEGPDFVVALLLLALFLWLEIPVMVPYLHKSTRKQRAWCGDCEGLMHMMGFSQET